MLVVLNDGTGQMCNKLLFHINILASAVEHDYIVKYYNKQNFEGFVCDCKEFHSRVLCVDNEPKVRLLMTRVGHKMAEKLGLKHKKYIMVGANSQSESAEILVGDYLKKKKVYLYGWPFYDLPALRLHGDIAREYLSPTSNIASEVAAKVSKIKNSEDIYLIGVHMRRGDYKNWRGGAYYYSDREYKKYMDAFSEIVDKKCAFILFSNEEINVNNFSGSGYKVIVAKGSAAEDFFTMSKCDYLIGPPSSFSGLASFYGRVPRYMMENSKSNLAMDKLLIWLEETDSRGLPL